jgi:hypothetical protein
MRKLILFITLLLSMQAYAVNFINMDFYYAYAKDETDGLNAKESASSFYMLNFLHLLESGARLGFTYRMENKGEDLAETMLGATVAFGSETFFFEFTYCPGTLTRKNSGTTEKGSAIILTPGLVLPFGNGMALRITLPIIKKSITDALSDKELLDYFPHIGISFAI